jgi:hypothetical protein
MIKSCSSLFLILKLVTADYCLKFSVLNHKLYHWKIIDKYIIDIIILSILKIGMK